MNIIKVPTNNYSDSSYVKIGHQIHKTLGTNSLAELTRAGTNKSANALFARDGTVYELVDGDKRSWAAGRISQPSARGKAVLLRGPLGLYVKPGHYLYQWEFECLSHQTYTEAQYKAFMEYCASKNIPIIPMLFLTHQDTAADKPNLEKERTEILARAAKGKPGAVKVVAPGSARTMSVKPTEKIKLSVRDGNVVITKA